MLRTGDVLSTAQPIESTSRSPLDDVDLRILDVLRDDGRISVTDLAARLGISRANVYARLGRLTEDGVITGYTAVVDSRKVGLSITAVIMIGTDQPQWGPVSEALRAMPEVEFAALTTGDFDGVVVVRVADMETLRDVILRRLQAMPEIKFTRTVFALDEIVRRHVVLP
jgi:DNA-binding Lrp family transcriptional regulator